LIVAIADYSGKSGWHDLNSDKDLIFIRTTLTNQGFGKEGIRELTGSKVDKERILSAFKRDLLERARPGDIVVFHYSGHGHRITDDNFDEIDGYDETLVPYDAPKRPGASYKGEKHIRDDELNGLLTQLREKLGPTGDLLVFLDSCNSGTGTRGEGKGEALVRGSLEPIGPPQPREGKVRGSDSGSGFVETVTPAARRYPEPEQKTGLSPYVVFTAAAHDVLAYETRDEGSNEWVGSLSLA
jgi:hypothetical protein